MLEFIPYVIPIMLNVVVGLVVFFFYQRSRKSGLELLSVAFFLNSIPSIVHLGLGGPYLGQRLVEQGLTVAEIRAFSMYLFLFDSALNIIFAVLVLIGAFKLSRENQTLCA